MALPRVKKLAPRKLLVAAIGIATINYVAACEKPPTSGNLPAPEPAKDAAEIPPTSGNLPAPVPVVPADAGTKDAR